MFDVCGISDIDAVFLAFLLLFLPLMYGKWKSGLVALGCFGLTGTMEYAIFFGQLNLSVELSLTILEIVVVQGTAFLLCRYRDARALFTGISSATYVLVGNVLYMGVTAFWGNSILWLVVALLFHLLVLVMLTVRLRSHYLYEMEHYSKSWNILCLIPALFYTVTYLLTCWPGSIYETRENWVAVLLIMFLMEMTYMMMIKLVSQQHLESDVERSREFLETYAEGLRGEADILRGAEDKIRVLRHDTRHVYQIIRIYLEEGRTEQIKELLDQLDGEMQSVASRRFCDNVIVNGIISGCNGKAQKDGIEFICRADVPKNLGSVNEFELATVISNLLDNAICAAKESGKEGKAKVVLRIFPVKGQLILEIKNTFSGMCEFSSVTGLPLSTKGKGHGYGLRSVRAYADKHKAIFRYSVENGLFCVRLLTDM